MTNQNPPQLDAAKLQALLDAVDRLTSSLALDEVLGHLLAIGQQLTSSQAGSVILHDAKQNDLYFAAATGPTAGDVKNIRIPVGKGKAGTVFARRLSPTARLRLTFSRPPKSSYAGVPKGCAKCQRALRLRLRYPQCADNTRSNAWGTPRNA